MKPVVGFLLLCFAGALPLCGEVFTLWPWKPSGNAELRQRLESLPGMSSEPLYTEELEINGRSLVLEAYRADAEFAELLRMLAARFPAESLQFGGDTIRLTFRLPDGRIDRWLLIDSGAGKPVTVFRVSAPEKLPEPVWPEALPPLPPGATPSQVVHFSDRGAWYGAFENAPDDPAGNLRAVEARLRSEGWIAAGNESASGGSGDLFLKPDGRGIAWVCFSGTRGAFYCRSR